VAPTRTAAAISFFINLSSQDGLLRNVSRQERSHTGDIKKDISIFLYMQPFLTIAPLTPALGLVLGLGAQAC